MAGTAGVSKSDKDKQDRILGSLKNDILCAAAASEKKDGGCYFIKVHFLLDIFISKHRMINVPSYIY